MRFLSKILLFVIFFLSIAIFGRLGIDDKISIPCFIGCAVFLIVGNGKKAMLFKYWELIAIILLIAVTWGIKREIKGDGNDFLTIFLAVPVFLFGCLPKISSSSTKKDVAIWRFVAKLVLFLFVTEFAVCAIEKVSGNYLFADATQIKLEDNGEFRSYALLGHPLQNALIMSTIMSFILISPIKINIKMTLWILGYVSILCFNTRSSIIGNALIFTIYVFYTVFVRKGVKARVKKWLIFASFFAFGVIAVLIVKYDLGGRLLKMGVNDDAGSTQTRLDAFSILTSYSFSDLTWGIDARYYDMILARSGIKILENWWIDFILYFGTLPFLIMIILYVLLIVHLYKGYDKFSIFISVITFWLICSTNNSLAATWVPLFLYMLLIKVFNPLYIRALLPSKILLNN